MAKMETIRNPKLGTITGFLYDKLANGTGTTSKLTLSAQAGIGLLNYRRYGMVDQIVNGVVCTINDDNLCPSQNLYMLAFGKEQGTDFYIPLPCEIRASGNVAVYFSSTHYIEDLYVITSYPIKP